MASDQSRLQKYLPSEDFRKVADARRSFWTGGFKGFVIGAALGLAGHRTNAMFRTLPKLVSRNHLFMAMLAGGGFGMFLGSYAGATQRRHDIHNVLRKHKDERLERRFEELKIKEATDPWDHRNFEPQYQQHNHHGANTPVAGAATGAARHGSGWGGSDGGYRR